MTQLLIEAKLDIFLNIIYLFTKIWLILFYDHYFIEKTIFQILSDI